MKKNFSCKEFTCRPKSFTFVTYPTHTKFSLTFVGCRDTIIPKGKVPPENNLIPEVPGTEEEEIVVMALTRKALAAMDIPAEKIEEIISAHTETVSALKEQIDSLKADTERLADVEAKLAEAEDKIKAADSAGWEKKYTDLKSEYDGYKSDVETKATKTAKENAYKKLLLDAGVSEKRIAAVMKVSDIDSIKINEDGTVQDADKISENVKTEWADFIEVKRERGANVANPPANTGGEITQPSAAALRMQKYQEEHYGKKED